MNASGSEVSLLISRLVAESGNPRWACRRFVRSMGIQARRPYRMWSEQEQQRLLKLIDLHPVNEIARLMRRSQSSIWHMLQRMGANAKMGKDNFTVYTLAEALHVRPEKIQEWISRGWLKTREVETGKAVRVIIEAEDFCEFCQKAHQGCCRKPSHRGTAGLCLPLCVPAKSCSACCRYVRARKSAMLMVRNWKRQGISDSALTFPARAGKCSIALHEGTGTTHGVESGNQLTARATS